jgi:putative ABC transport system substrate-binding protein
MRWLRWAIILVAVVLNCLILKPAEAQQIERVYRLGVLSPLDRASDSIFLVTLSMLAEKGFVESRNLLVEEHRGPANELPDLARSLIASKPDVIIASSDWAIRPAGEATHTIPIVMSPAGTDPVTAGLAASWARPGGNVTGVVLLEPELAGKRIQLLLEAIPAARRIAVLATHRLLRQKELRAAAAQAGVELAERIVNADPAEYQAAIEEIRGTGAQALEIIPTPELYRDGVAVARLALTAGLPTVCGFRELAERGCLIGYGPSILELGQRTADYIVRIFWGAAPSELPITGPTYVKLVVNLKTANALGIELPPSLLARADEVIE